MSYRGLLAQVEFDAEDEIFVGRIAGINDVVGFHADTSQGLKDSFHDAVDGYLDACRLAGREPEQSFSGRITLRVTPHLHRQLALASELSGRSIDQIGEDAIARFFDRDGGLAEGR